MDPRYEGERDKFARRLATKKDLKGLIDLNNDGSINIEDAKLMFDADEADSDGDGVNNFMERAFEVILSGEMPINLCPVRLIKRMGSKELLSYAISLSIIRN